MKNRLLPLLMLLLPLTACTPSPSPAAAELHIFAAASLTETMDQLLQLYKAESPDVTLLPTYDSSGTLLTQIREGASCDVFLSASPRQMDALEDEGGLLEGTRLDLLENKVVLAVPEGNPGDIASFGQLAERLRDGNLLLAVGNSDVPVGQYTRKLFAYYDLEEPALADSGVLTYGSNAKEVTTQVAEASVDCGVIYATDAFSAGLAAVDQATAEMCGQVLYPAAVLRDSACPDEAKAFLDFLTTPEAAAVFESVGFTPLT